MMKMKNRPAWLRITAGVMCLSAISACDNLSRFKQERYECGYNPTGIVEIDFRSMKIGDSVIVTFLDRTQNATISEATEENFTLSSEGLVVRIDRESGIIRMARDTQYINIRCKKTVFTM
jgi:hypothetical protein